MDIRQSMQYAASRAIVNERKKGNHERANGLALIVMGIFLMPIPLVGISILIYGIIKCCSAPDHSEQ